MPTLKSRPAGGRCRAGGNDARPYQSPAVDAEPMNSPTTFAPTGLQLRRPRFPALFLCLLVLALAYEPGAAHDPYQELVARKRVLSARLDSLEMLKQARKRQGRELAELEENVSRVKDSIAAVRAEVAALTPASQVAPPLEPGADGFLGRLASLRPQGILDWVIVAVGAVAVLSGIVLVVGLLHTIVGGSRRRPKRARPSRSVPAPSVRPRSASPAAGVPPTVSGAPADIDSEGLESLRQRMHDDIERIRRFDEEHSPFDSERPAPAPEPVDEGAGEVRDRVLAAARQGLDVQEISRRLHLSVDQVALILRVSGRG